MTKIGRERPLAQCAARDGSRRSRRGRVPQRRDRRCRRAASAASSSSSRPRCAPNRAAARRGARLPAPHTTRLRDACATEMLGHQLAHLAGAEQQHRAQRSRSPCMLARELERGRGDRTAAARRCRVSRRTRRAAGDRRAAKRRSRARHRRGRARDAARCAALTWPSTCGSPTTWLSSALATAKRWRSAASPSWR